MSPQEAIHRRAALRKERDHLRRAVARLARTERREIELRAQQRAELKQLLEKNAEQLAALAYK